MHAEDDQAKALSATWATVNIGNNRAMLYIGFYMIIL